MRRSCTFLSCLTLVACFEPVSPVSPSDAGGGGSREAGVYFDAAAPRDVGSAAESGDASLGRDDGAGLPDSCVPDCSGWSCSDDGCGGSCGECPAADAAILDASIGADAARECPNGLLRCGVWCIDPATDRFFCGASGDCAGPLAGTPCAEGVECRAGSCTPPTCSDGLQNGGESDLDCGGPCGATCGYGAGCHWAADCQSGMICNDWTRRCDCAAGSHHCQAGCRADTDAKYCGAGCDDCTASTPGNAFSTCRNAACDFECLPGFCESGGGCAPLSSLTLTIGGDGEGTVSALGLSCGGSACAGNYCPDALITLRAEPAVGTAVSWGQDCSSAGARSTCTLTMSQARTVTVDFLQGGVTLTVSVFGVEGATGEVSSSAHGVACGQDCVVIVPRGTVVELGELPAAGSYFGGWGGSCSGFGKTCTVLMDGDRMVTGAFSPANYIFVTSTTYNVTALGGVNGADAACQARAQAAGLPGTYVAWLSTTAASARARIGAARGWVRTDLKPFADTFDSDPGSVPAVFYSPSLDEFGAAAQPSPVLTGTTPNGDLSPTNCNDFTSSLPSDTTAAGIPTSGAEMWSAYSYLCGVPTPLYCLEVDHRVALRFPPSEGRSAFLTSSSFLPSAGIAAADALCMAEAGAAGLTGSFKALLSTSAVAAAARFVDGPPWVRTDGVRVVEWSSDLLQNGVLDEVINVTADGHTYLRNRTVWTGSADATQPGTAATTCNDWTTNALSSRGTSSESGLLALLHFGGGETTCNFWAAYLICLEE